jgi:glyoxylase I family protein
MSFQYRLEHLGFATPDPRMLAHWYVEVLGGELVWENGATPPALFVRLPGGLVLEIYSSTTASPEVGLNHLAGFRHLALRVDSIETAKASLERKGVTFHEPIKPAGGGGRVLFFRDPCGNLLHLVERPSDAALHLL